MVEPEAVVPDSLLKELAAASNATVLGLLLKRGYARVYMEGVHTLAPGRRLIGRAVTLRYLPSRPDLQKRIAFGKTADGMNDTPRWRALEALGVGDVLVADAMRLGNVSTGGDVVFSCLKQAEDGSGLVLRVFNPNPQPEAVTLSVPARRIRLDEEEDVDGGFDLAPGEIATFLLGK